MSCFFLPKKPFFSTASQPSPMRTRRSAPPAVLSSETVCPLVRLTPSVIARSLPAPGPVHAPAVRLVERALGTVDVVDLALDGDLAVLLADHRDRADARP